MIGKHRVDAALDEGTGNRRPDAAAAADYEHHACAELCVLILWSHCRVTSMPGHAVPAGQIQ
jgi:hypothetical protein